MSGEPTDDRKEPIAPGFDGPVYPPARGAAKTPRTTANPTPPSPAGPPATAIGAPQVRPIFISDVVAGPDALGRAAPLSRLSELLAHRGAQGPLSIALLGGPGSGKTHALADVVEGAGLLATAALSAPGGPFLPRIVVLRLEAAELGDEPEVVVAERLHARLSREYPHVAQVAAEEAAHASADPRQTARALADSLDVTRKRLVAEREARDEAMTRRARLTETVLYQTPGSRIDSYARNNRARIEPPLRGFGFTSADSTADYKGLVHDLVESGGPASRALALLRSLWAYKGQKKLIFFAILLLCVSWGLSLLTQDRSVFAPLESGGESLRSVAAWFATHLSWFAAGSRLAEFGALLCLLLLVWRAWRFVQPLWRGASLLEFDIAARKGDLERQIAHHTQRVDVLAREANALGERAAEAERRAGGPDSIHQLAPDFLRAGPSRAAQARAYFAALDAIVAADGARPAGALPSRFVIALDSLDRAAPAKGLAILTAVSSALARPAFALVSAFDPHHFDGVENAGVALARIVQTPFTLSAADTPGWTALVEHLAGRAAPARAARAPQNASTLDMPLTEPETKLLAALAQLAGPTPRGINRLVNLYRLARRDAPDDLAAACCMLALRIGGTEAEKQAVARAMSSPDSFAPFAAPDAGPRVAAGLAAATAAQGGPINNASARRASAVARMWTM